MNVDFLHNQIIRDTISQKFIESFNENLLPSLCLKYGESLECVQFYEDHIADGLRINGVFYYPLTVVIAGTARVQWINWQVSNYRHYDSFNPFTYKGSDLLTFKMLDSVDAKISEKTVGRTIYSAGNTTPIILSAVSNDKTFLAGKYSQSFIDLLSASVTEAIEEELAISGLAGSGTVLEMNFMPGTFMEHKVGNTTYRRLKIKARGCSARDLWVKWTRLDGVGTYTISDTVDREDIKFELAEDVPGNIKEREYRYLTGESVEKYQASMGRKNITEWREMMRRVIRRGEVERNERIRITKPIAEPDAFANEPAAVSQIINAVTIPSAVERERDELTERLNALLGKTAEDISSESAQEVVESSNSDINDLLRSALGAASVPTFDEGEPVTDTPTLDAACEESVSVPEAPVAEQKGEQENEIEARIRRELEEKMRTEMEALRRKTEEAEQLREKLEAQKRAEARERERLAEAARLAVLDKEKREADRRAEEERDRIEAERKAAEEARIEEERRRAEERTQEEARIKAELQAQKQKEETTPTAPPTVYVSKTVTLIFRRGGVDSSMTKRVREIIVATIKYMHKEDVYIRIKASIVDPTTLVLVFSEVPMSEEQLIVDIIQVLGKSNIGITKAILE